MAPSVVTSAVVLGIAADAHAVTNPVASESFGRVTTYEVVPIKFTVCERGHVSVVLPVFCWISSRRYQWKSSG